MEMLISLKDLEVKTLSENMSISEMIKTLSNTVVKLLIAVKKLESIKKEHGLSFFKKEGYSDLLTAAKSAIKSAEKNKKEIKTWK